VARTLTSGSAAGPTCPHSGNRITACGYAFGIGYVQQRIQLAASSISSSNGISARQRARRTFQLSGTTFVEHRQQDFCSHSRPARARRHPFRHHGSAAEAAGMIHRPNTKAPQAVLRLPDLDLRQARRAEHARFAPSKRAYQFGIDDFVSWYCSDHGWRSTEPWSCATGWN